MGEFRLSVIGDGCSLIPKLADWNAFLKDRKYLFYYQRILEEGKKNSDCLSALKIVFCFMCGQREHVARLGFFYYYYFLLSRKHWQLDCSDQ